MDKIKFKILVSFFDILESKDFTQGGLEISFYNSEKKLQTDFF